MTRPVLSALVLSSLACDSSERVQDAGLAACAEERCSDAGGDTGVPTPPQAGHVHDAGELPWNPCAVLVGDDAAAYNDGGLVLLPANEVPAPPDEGCLGPDL